MTDQGEGVSLFTYLYFSEELTQKGELKGLINAIKILTKFIVNVYLYDKDFKFLEEKINKLDKINSLIYNELIKEYNENEFDKIKEYSEKDFEKMKEYIYEQFLTKLDDINNIEALLTLWLRLVQEPLHLNIDM